MNHTKNALEDAAGFYCRGRWGRWGAAAILCLALVTSGFSQALAGGFAIIAGPQGEYIVFAGQFRQPLRDVSATCVNEAQGEQRIVLSGANVFPGFVLSITPGSGWVWQPGEKLVVRSPSLDEPLVFAIPPDSHPRWSAFVAQARALGAQLSGLSWATGAPVARPFDPNADLMAPGYEPETVAGGCPYCHGSGTDPQPEAGSEYFIGSSQLEANSYCPLCRRDVISTHRHGRCPRCEGRGMVRELR